MIVRCRSCDLRFPVSSSIDRFLDRDMVFRNVLDVSAHKPTEG